jgi:hypothetical protein
MTGQPTLHAVEKGNAPKPSYIKPLEFSDRMVSANPVWQIRQSRDGGDDRFIPHVDYVRNRWDHVLFSAVLRHSPCIPRPEARALPSPALSRNRLNFGPSLSWDFKDSKDLYPGQSLQ